MTKPKKKPVVKKDKLQAMNTPDNLLALAIEKGAGLEQLEKLLELRDRYEKTEAEKAFNLAMSGFQEECPVIQKKKVVKDKYGKIRYSFAPIGDIVSQIKKPLSNNGLFYDFTTKDADGCLDVTCTVTHEKGHSKSTSFKVPIGDEQYMTDVQKHGARMTFAKRYALCNAFGISTADEDIDAEETPKKPEAKLKPELNEKSDKWDDAVNALFKKSVTIAQLRKHYTLTKQNEVLLWEQVDNLKSSK